MSLATRIVTLVTVTLPTPQPSSDYTSRRFHLPVLALTWFDYDNDGRPDLFVANGAVTGIESLRGEPYPFHQRNLLVHNEGAKFREVSAEAGAPFTLCEVGRGAAFGDVNNDGRVDIVLSNNNGPLRLLLNETGPLGRGEAARR
jgi:hypothetical protein